MSINEKVFKKYKNDSCEKKESETSNESCKNKYRKSLPEKVKGEKGSEQEISV